MADGVKKQDFARAADKIGGVKLTQTQVRTRIMSGDLTCCT